MLIYVEKLRSEGILESELEDELNKIDWQNHFNEVLIIEDVPSSMSTSDDILIRKVYNKVLKENQQEYETPRTAIDPVEMD